jgi:hypothetical protein
MDGTARMMDGIMLALTAAAVALVCIPIATLLLGWLPFAG